MTSTRNRPTTSWLEVHVFGSSSKGEGTILRLPDTRYAVIDCCYQGDITDSNSNPMVTFLRERKVNGLAFVCLTHPHEDHYYGLSQIFSSFHVDEYWRSAAFTPTQLLKIVKREKLEAYEYEDTARQRAINELIRIDKTWNEVKKRKSPKRLLANLKPYPSGKPKNQQFGIRCISPCDDEISAYETLLEKCLKEDGLSGKSFSLPHNRISIGLQIECKKFSLILGGDMEEKNWEPAIREASLAEAKLKFIKISHHGSQNGQCNGLWSLLAKSDPIAVVTGYKQQRLPRPEMIDVFKSHTSQLACTHHISIEQKAHETQRPRTASQSNAEKFFANDSRVSDLASGFRGIEKIHEATYGRCSYYFDKSGNLERCETDHPAVKI